MAPPSTYESPQVQLGRLMLAARRRGQDFEDFWAEAVREGRSLVMTNHKNPPPNCVRWPTDRNDRQAWQFAIMQTKDAWRRAYERIEPTPAERAMAVLGEAITRQARAIAEGAADTLAAA